MGILRSKRASIFSAGLVDHEQLCRLEKRIWAAKMALKPSVGQTRALYSEARQNILNSVVYIIYPTNLTLSRVFEKQGFT